MAGVTNRVRLFVAIVGLLPVLAWWAHPALLRDERSAVATD
jgi:hypothetical protein